MRRICETTGASEQVGFITGKGNFRYEVYSEYKANRRGKSQPIYRRDAEDYLVDQWGAVRTIGYEADDALGIRQSNSSDSVICTIDKDLDMIPGLHYNWRKNELYQISPVAGLQSFYRSTLIGDSVDNIEGVAGIGKVKSARLINDLENEQDMFTVVRALYNDDERLLMNGRLLWIWRKENDLWRFPFEPKEPAEEELPAV